MADLVAQDLVVEEADARGDLGLVGEELDAAIAERAEDDAAGHLGAPGERPVPALGGADEELHDHARGERRRPDPDRQAEDRDRIGEDARVVVGYLLKNVAPDEIRATVERAAAGEPMLSGEIAGRVLREFEREREEERYREQLDALTAREEEILKLLATGESNREIGRRLFISEQTVKNHVASIFRKLQVNDRTKAALLAVKLGLGEKRPS